MAKRGKFSKLYYITLSGEKKLNGASVYVPKDVIEASGIDIEAPLEITAVKGTIQIKKNKA